MKWVRIFIPCLFFLSCGESNNNAPFPSSDDAAQLEVLADKALREAEQKVDSLFYTPLLDTSYFNAPQ